MPEIIILHRDAEHQAESTQLTHAIAARKRPRIGSHNATKRDFTAGACNRPLRLPRLRAPLRCQ